MKLYTVKSGLEGAVTYVNNWVVIAVIIIVLIFGGISINSPTEKIEYERIEVCK